ncbi:MAG TPA: hypothetical protein VFE24_17980 [Pirellulales bacterium]|nr:hypothetical protein [Pirellulales bacterium]
MKTIYSFTAAFVFALGLAASALASPQATLQHLLLTTAGLGDPGPAHTSVEDLLKQARQAMDEGNLELADSFISRAEAQHPSYGPLHFGDTPKKARADLDRKRAKSGTAQKPSSLFNPGGGSKAKPSDSAANGKDPFAGHLGTDAAGASPAETPNHLPNAAAAHPLPKGPDGTLSTYDPSAQIAPPAGKSPWAHPNETPSGRAVMSAPPAEPAADLHWPTKPDGSAPVAEDAKSQSDDLLRSSRKALAVGDVRRATALLEQAKSMKVEYSPLDNEPAKVESLIRRQAELAQSKAGGEADDHYKREYSDLLLEEAQAMVRLGELDEAERLAGDAQRLNLQYTAFETKPSSILDKVAQARGQIRQTGSALNKTAPVAAAGAAAAGTAAFAELPPVKQTALNSTAKQEVQSILSEARVAIAQGDFAKADQLVQQADAWRIPDTDYIPGEDRPGLVRYDLQKARQHAGEMSPPTGRGVVIASYGEPIGSAAHAAEGAKIGATRAVFDPSQDTTHNIAATATSPNLTPAVQAYSGDVRPAGGTLPPPPDLISKPASTGTGVRFFQQGEESLKIGDADQALKFFRQANTYRSELDPGQQKALREHLQTLSSQLSVKRPGNTESLLPAAAANQQVLAKQVSAELARKQAEAKSFKEKNEPKKAMETLTKMRATIEQSELDQRDKDLLLRRADREIGELSKYIEENRAQIELDANNKEVLATIDREKKVKLENQEKMAKLVEEFNTLMHEQRYAEAEVVAKKANQLDPTNPVVVQVVNESKFASRLARDRENADSKERAIVEEFQDIDSISKPFKGPYEMPDVKSWQQLTDRRRKSQADGRKRSPKELEIEQRLSTPISFKFQERPLEEVIKYIGQMAQVNIHLDPQGLSAEGAQSSDPVTIDLHFDISVRSALNLILAPKHLSYVIKNEVLLITSEHLRDNNVITVNYNVADLVIPIPNFVPNANMGMAAAIREGYNRANAGGIPGNFAGIGGPTAVVAANDAGNGIARLNPNLLHQVRAAGAGGASAGAGGANGNNVIGHGPGGLGGGTHADFDSLIELITSTVRPTSWDAVGGPGSVKGFEGTLSLVVSQTQEVHDEIADLLKQLRKLQDLQVTIEVRFITLSDAFFERIGFDFEFDLKDRSGLQAGGIQNLNPNAVSLTSIVGLSNSAVSTGGLGAQPYNNISPNNNVQFRQGSFGDTVASPVSTVPFTTNPASFGFAILSDIEAYFLVQAAQGDNRSNILQAPKVTLFNGQQAFVSDTTQRPFVISVVPVVGDFAAAQQPIIVVLSEGTSLTVQAVVSADRRFVRLTVVPFFSQIGDVQTFTFEGTSSTTKASSSTNDATSGNQTAQNANDTQVNQGTTVQLPTFSFVTVTTTVSVPDGGTVLLGGIKRLSEGRNESGIPLLSKLPYINRLFKNTAIARSTSSLMMMVTPRIIIQDEEEEKLLGNSAAP